MCVAVGGLEGTLRLAGLNVREELPLFIDFGGGDIGLVPCASARVRTVGGGVTDVNTDPYGLRTQQICTPTGSGAAVLGDEQVFGQGVSFEESFAGRLELRNAGVPGYGVLDALALGRLSFTLSGVATVLLVVNQANDWDDGATLVGERNVVNAGYLLPNRWQGRPGAWVWEGPFANSALAYTVGNDRSIPIPESTPRWARDPASQAELSRTLGSEILEFAKMRPSLRVVPVWMPADLATSEARATVSPLGPAKELAELRPWEDTTLRDQLAEAVAPLPLVDLTESLRDPESFLPHDPRLSATGHAAVAARLAAILKL